MKRFLVHFKQTESVSDPNDLTEIIVNPIHMQIHVYR